MPELKISDDLRNIAKGNVFSDDWNKKIYSVDASDYCFLPECVVQVKDKEDISNICKYAYLNDLSVTGRGAGTGLLGQSLNSGICIDFTKYMTKIIELENDYVIVEPGIVKGVLDKELRKRGKFLPPDPASSNYCTIGGMIANNSSGIHALRYGNTIDFLEGIEIIYSDGSIDSLIQPNKNKITKNENKRNKSSTKLDKLFRLFSEEILETINLKFPKVTKNSCGYRIDTLIDNTGRYLPHKIFASSECTLGITSLAKFKILDLPLYRSILVIGFENILKAVKVVPLILTLSPSALELLDSTVLNYNNLIYNPNQTKSDNSDQGTILFIEFDGNNGVEVESRLGLCKEKLFQYGEILQMAYDGLSLDKIWSARKSALNNVMKLTVGSRKPLTLIEDTVVNPQYLYDYTHFLLEVYRKYKLDHVFYGHAGNGNLHTRPILDDTSIYNNLIKSVANEVFSKVYEYSGSITAEHGDGIGRSKYISEMYGKVFFEIFKKIKFIFDPTNIMNPGKKIIQ
ncbi:MAG TPA: FAD-binding oxidoreductase [Nitrososphaeraceae archaeon]|nr:FAD-binding oxidoreductase [Nitrososphaeraceae archaeon]